MYAQSNNTGAVWYENLRKCETMNATLVTVKSKEENDFLFNWIKNDTLYYWLSAQRVNTTAQFKWIDGSNLTYSNWKSGQPDQLNTKNALCLDMYSEDGEWYDFACNNKGFDIFGQMCEKEINEQYQHFKRTSLNSALNKEIKDIQHEIEALKQSLHINELNEKKRYEEIHVKLSKVFDN
ncbi:aggrecan core protein-like protein, partial [Leptotrombidium deliense]